VAGPGDELLAAAAPVELSPTAPEAPGASGNGRAPPSSGGGGVAVATPPRVSAERAAPADAAGTVATRADSVLADAGVAALALAAVAAALDAALAAHRLSAAALHDYLLANFSGVARIAVVGLVGLALALGRRAPRVAAVAAAAALAAVVASGHANSADPRGVAIVADVVHLIAAAVWVGGAATLVLAWGPALREPAARQLVARRVLPRFGRVALTAFAVVVVAGVVNAIVEVGRVAALWETSYGVVLLVKVGLVALVAAAAWTHAYRLRPRWAEGGARAAGERAHWRALRAEPLLGVGVVGAAAFLIAFPLPPRQADQAARQVGRVPACTACPLPTPARDELSVGAQAGSQTVAAWVRRRGGGLTGTVRALDFRGRPARQAPRVPGARTATCGPGCVSFALASAPPELRVLVGEGGRSYAAALPVRWDPAGARRARGLLDRAERTMRALRSVVEDERVTSGPGTLAVARYWLRAPDRVAYRTGAGAQSVQIGARQWVRVGRGPWAQAPAAGGLPFRTRTWFRWTPYARSVALLGESGGVARIALMDPGTPVWVRLWIERRSGRVRREELVAPARLIRHRFHSFDRPVAIRAPRGAIRGD
jgi:copper transport protein